MLDAGFSPIEYLRSRLLPNAAVDDTEWDDALKKLGLSVAARIERHCGREFARTQAGQEQYAARTFAIVLKCYPVEVVSSIQLRDTAGNLTSVTSSWQIDKECGLIDFMSIPGTAAQRLVVTYTGGYWLDPLDGTAMPVNATPLPDDILEAWLVQCQLQAESLGTFEAVAIRPSKQGDQAGSKLAALTLAPDVVAILRPYRRIGGE